MDAFAERLKAEARRLGFARAGIAPAAEADDFAHLSEWLARGFAGDMSYMSTQGPARRHPASILPNVRSVVMVALKYADQASGGRQPPDDLTVVEGGPDIRGLTPPARLTGRVARYARGADYHDVLRARLNALLAWVQAERPGTQGRGVVDTAPLLERDFARRAGLGWIGKNTMLIDPRLGSYFFLGALLLDLELPPDEPFAADHCGTCTRCLEACPTDAFVGPGQLDARRCISYLTIELRGSVPDELRPGLGDWLFGCDVCQEVCPWNHKAPAGGDAALAAREDLVAPDLVELLGLTEEAFRRRFRGTALFRTKRRGLLRNAALVLGNRGDAAALPALEKALDDSEPLVREAAQWAIDRIRQTAPA